MKLDTPWYWAALAAIVPAGAAVGTGGLLAGHAAIVVITLGIFFGTLSIGRHASPQTASATPIPPPVAEDRKALSGPSATVRGADRSPRSSTVPPWPRAGLREHPLSQDHRLKRIEEMSLADLESVRLILRGDSVVDWHRLDFRDEAEARRFLQAQELHPDDPADRARLESIKNEAIAYLRRNFDFAIPRPIERMSVEELLLLASGKGHRQVCACTVLKAMHIIHHLDGRELMFVMPMSSQDLFQLVEERVYRVIGGMLAAGMPITEFIGGRKTKDSLYSKLLSKAENSAAAIYDKIRFRIVTRDASDLIPVLSYLTEHLIPFNYVVPGQSINTIFHFRSYCEGVPHLSEMIPHFQGKLDDQFTPSDNRFSASSYRVMHFVADLPVRLPAEMMERAPPSAWSLGHIVFALVEFQLIDRATELANEVGDASHASYKERQRLAVARRLKLGTREMRQPASAAGPPASSRKTPNK